MENLKRIHFYTNLVKEGWSAKNLESGVGGSEEKLIELTRELAKDPSYEVTVYHNGEHGTFDSVLYRDHTEFKSWMSRYAFVGFKNREMWTKTVGGRKKIHWSMEIEPEFRRSELENIDHIITISDFHKRQLRENSKLRKSYLWIDNKRHDNLKVDKEKGSMLYSASFDRGLEELLQKWPVVREKLSLSKLYITYGWDFIDKIIAMNPAMATWKSNMQKLIKQDGIEFIGRITYDEMARMYWKCEYWCLPLNNPQSELFCLNAVKAQFSNSIPVVRRIGALQETVKNFIDFDELVGQKNAKSNFSDKSIEENRLYSEQFNIDTGVNEWKQLLD